MTTVFAAWRAGDTNFNKPKRIKTIQCTDCGTETRSNGKGIRCKPCSSEHSRVLRAIYSKNKYRAAKEQVNAEG